MKKFIPVLGLFLIVSAAGFSQGRHPAGPGNTGIQSGGKETVRYLHLPERPEGAVGGLEFARRITGLSVPDREKAAVREILSGNVPSFSRKLRAITVRQTIHGRNYELVFFAACDYMAVGSDGDYLYMPMTPSTAQYLADSLNCSLPTQKMVDLIYSSAEIKLRPQPIPPSEQMTTVPVFVQHTDSIRQQIARLGIDRSADFLIAGHKKDVIISNKIYSSDRDYERVVIYGWHRSENNPIQPVYNGHLATYADYSHGIRLISNLAFLNGDSCDIRGILQDSTLSVLLSSEGVIAKPYYPKSDLFTRVGTTVNQHPAGFGLSQNFPNPFNPTTVIRYRLPQAAAVDLSIFNLTGGKVITLVRQKQLPGEYEVRWNASSYASGMYVCRLKAGPFEQSHKIMVLR